eukprot:scaffold19_cov169-Amphora_coffeaeformis.AAC.4
MTEDYAMYTEAVRNEDRNRITASNTNTTTTSCRGGRGGDNLSRPTEFRRVGASIGHESSPTLHDLLTTHVSDMLVDEEDGLVAMFQEMSRQLPSARDVQAPLRRALQQLWQAWLSVQAAGHETGRALTDPDIGVTAFFRELVETSQSSKNKELSSASSSSSSSAAAVSTQKDASLSSATAFLDALLAQLLHSFYKVKKTAQQTATETAELVVPTPTAPMDDVDVSMVAMFREASQHFPSSRLRSADDVERHLLGRLQQIAQESQLETTATTTIERVVG